jgi:hypothetical protein
MQSGAQLLPKMAKLDGLCTSDWCYGVFLLLTQALGTFCIFGVSFLFSSSGA